MVPASSLLGDDAVNRRAPVLADHRECRASAACLRRSENGATPHARLGKQIETVVAAVLELRIPTSRIVTSIADADLA